MKISALHLCWLAVGFCCALTKVLAAESPTAEPVVIDKYGAIVRGDVTKKQLAIIFTGDEFGEATADILATLAQRKVKGGFFVTGNFVRQPKLNKLLRQAVAEGHYVGPHSDSHPLYCSWEERDKSLVTRKFFRKDLDKNVAALRELGALDDGRRVLFIPPYEWFNADQAHWSKEMGVTLFNFTPGSGSNRDYAREEDSHFVSSQKIYDDVLAYERKDAHGLNGFLLLMHLGSGRKDSFHRMLGPLCDELMKRGYEFERVDKMLFPER